MDNNDVDASVKTITFYIRSSGPNIDISGMDVTFPSSKLTKIDFGAANWWTSGAGVSSQAQVTFGSLYRVPTSDTATTLTFKADPGDIQITIYFDDSSSINVDVINV